MCVRSCFTAIAAASMLFASASDAVCPAEGFYRYVGNKAIDGVCDYDNIPDAISYAGTTTCRVNIVITSSHTYTAQALDINNLSVSLIGSGMACGNKPTLCDLVSGCGGGGVPPTPPVTLDGNGSSSVIYIHGTSHVTVQSLEITGGSTDYGGGIHFSGVGWLNVVDSIIVFNDAAYGGAIQFNGSGGDATLTLGAGTIIEENNASADGGGIQINGTARLFALEPYTYVGYNHATSGHGGGIAVVGPARADIGSPGFNGAPIIDSNDAASGGGISATGGSDSSLDVTVRVFTTDSNNPVQISNNTASANGGAIYLKPVQNALSNVYSYSTACAFNYRINHNIAAEGAAIYLDSDSSFGSAGDTGSFLELNPSSNCGPESPPSLGSVACMPGVACNEINGNVTENASNQPTDGAVVLVGSGSSISASRWIMRNNTAANLIKAIGQPGDNNYGLSVFLYNGLLADNHTQNELISVHNDQHVRLRDSTLAHNTIDNGYVLYVTDLSSLDLEDSIIDMPGVATLDMTSGPGFLDASYLLSNDVSTLPASPNIVQGEPTFVGEANGDYHLLPTSLGVDFAPSAGGVDLDGMPRDVDLAPVPNFGGPRDIGAYERQFVCAADTVFCNGFDAYQ